LEGYDPEACYDISCTANGLNPKGQPFVKFTFDENVSEEEGVHDALNSPFELSGKVEDSRCAPLGDSCEDLKVTIEAWQNPDKTKDINLYKCQSKVITCSPPPCPEPKYELKCFESVNPSGKHIPTAGDNTVDEGKHQNPDGFYTFGFFSNCGDPFCDPDYGDEVTLYSGLTPDNKEDKLVAYTGYIDKLKGKQRAYQVCDTVKYTQFADGKDNKEKKMGSDPENVRAHLQGSGDMVVKATDPEGNEHTAYCKVPKPPTRA